MTNQLQFLSSAPPHLKLFIHIVQQQTHHNSNVVQWASHLCEFDEPDRDNSQLSSVLDELIFWSQMSSWGTTGCFRLL